LCRIGVALVLPLAPFGNRVRQQVSQAFVVASIALIGWLSIRAVDLAAAR
jgi:hypothetical protein